MSRQFSKVSPAVWGSRRFFELGSDSAKLLYMYFLTNEHTNSTGAYRVKEGYALADLGWSAEKYQGAVAMLQEADLVAYDAEHETVYVRRWFRHNPPMNEKHAQGCRRLLTELDSETIAAMAMADFEEAEFKRRPPNAPGERTFVSPSLSQKLASGGRGF